MVKMLLAAAFTKLYKWAASEQGSSDRIFGSFRWTGSYWSTHQKVSFGFHRALSMSPSEIYISGVFSKYFKEWGRERIMREKKKSLAFIFHFSIYSLSFSSFFFLSSLLPRSISCASFFFCDCGKEDHTHKKRRKQIGSWMWSGSHRSI